MKLDRYSFAARGFRDFDHVNTHTQANVLEILSYCIVQRIPLESNPSVLYRRERSRE